MASGEKNTPGRRGFLAAAAAIPALAALRAFSSEADPARTTEPTPPPEESRNMPDKLVVLWTSGDREVALKMAFMYTFNAKARGWWKEVTLIVWGASARLLSVDIELREYVQRMLDTGVKLQACKACADSFGVSDNLAALGIEVKGMGQPLTEYLKDPNVRIITI